MAFGECKTCEAYKEQIKYLQGLLDQTLNMIAPKTESVEAEPVEPEDKQTVKYGE